MNDVLLTESFSIPWHHNAKYIMTGCVIRVTICQGFLKHILFWAPFWVDFQKSTCPGFWITPVTDLQRKWTVHVLSFKLSYRTEGYSLWQKYSWVHQPEPDASLKNSRHLLFIYQRNRLYHKQFLLLQAVTIFLFHLNTCGNFTGQCSTAIDTFCTLFCITKYGNPMSILVNDVVIKNTVFDWAEVCYNNVCIVLSCQVVVMIRHVLYLWYLEIIVNVFGCTCKFCVFW